MQLMLSVCDETYAIFKTIVTDHDLQLLTYQEVLDRLKQAEKRHRYQLPIITQVDAIRNGSKNKSHEKPDDKQPTTDDDENDTPESTPEPSDDENSDSDTQEPTPEPTDDENSDREDNASEAMPPATKQLHSCHAVFDDFYAGRTSRINPGTPMHTMHSFYSRLNKLECNPQTAVLSTPASNPRITSPNLFAWVISSVYPTHGFISQISTCLSSWYQCALLIFTLLNLWFMYLWTSCLTAACCQINRAITMTTSSNQCSTFVASKVNDMASYQRNPDTMGALIAPCTSGFPSASIRSVNHHGTMEKQVASAKLLPIDPGLHQTMRPASSHAHVEQFYFFSAPAAEGSDRSEIKAGKILQYDPHLEMCTIQEYRSPSTNVYHYQPTWISPHGVIVCSRAPSTDVSPHIARVHRRALCLQSFINRAGHIPKMRRQRIPCQAISRSVK
jgi:hypothetical protein